jgi:putative ABC transport system substrate-binding protein
LNNRRKLVAFLGASALAAPLASFAQQLAKIPRIGFLSTFSPSEEALWLEAFRLGLRDLGWIEGKNVVIEYRYAEGRSDRIADLAADLVRIKVDLIVVTTTTSALAAKKATRTIPIVMASVGDPVASGIVASLARPGSNITGLSQMAQELVGKRLELLKEIVPKLSRVAVLWNPQDASSTLNWKEIQFPARQLGIHLLALEVRNPTEFDKAFKDATKARAGALVITPAVVFVLHFKRIADLATKYRLLSIYHRREFPDSGGLMAYGVDRSDMFRRAATFVDKILKGAKPADLPVEQPMKFELVLNKRTARDLGIKIPNSILVQATTVIE